MGGFDEILALEDALLHLKEDLVEVDRGILVLESKLTKAEMESAEVEKRIKERRINLNWLILEAPVVSMEEWTGVRLSLEGDQDLLNSLESDELKYKRLLEVEQKKIPEIEDRIKQTQKSLDKYGQLLRGPW